MKKFSPDCGRLQQGAEAPDEFWKRKREVNDGNDNFEWTGQLSVLPGTDCCPAGGRPVLLLAYRLCAAAALPESIRVVTEKPSHRGENFFVPGADGLHRLPRGYRQHRGCFHRGVPRGLRRGVFGCGLIAIIGGASAFVESTLAQVYKRRDENGDSYGGPVTTLKPPCITAALPCCSPCA